MPRYVVVLALYFTLIVAYFCSYPILSITTLDWIEYLWSMKPIQVHKRVLRILQMLNMFSKWRMPIASRRLLVCHDVFFTFILEGA